MIELKNISRKFLSGKSSTDALINIDLKIKEGEFLALVGPSGSGKTTLLNLIGGLDIPSEGNVLIRTKAINTYKDKELSQFRNHEIGFIFQEFNLESFLTVKENIILPTFFNSNSNTAEKRALKLIKEVGLEDKTNSKINELSGGQKQRVAIARALINSPKILLADEPTGNLDLKTGETIINLLKEIHKTHKTTLIIATHDLNIAKCAARVIKVKDGKLTK